MVCFGAYHPLEMLQSLVHLLPQASHLEIVMMEIMLALVLLFIILFLLGSPL